MPYQSRFFPATGTKNSAGNSRKAVQTSPPGYGHLLGYQPHNRPADDLPERVQLSAGGKDCGAHFLIHMVVHPGGQHRLLDGAHKPRQQEHQQHEPKAPPHREENQAQDIPGAGGHDHTGSADSPFFFSMRAMSN